MVRRHAALTSFYGVDGRRERIVGTLTSRGLTASLAAWLLACGPASSAATDAGPCTLRVTAGRVRAGRFGAWEDGASVEVTLGFQGFYMLELDVDLEQPRSARVELATNVEVLGTGIEVHQGFAPWDVETLTDSHSMARGYLIFFNDQPSAAWLGRQAELELIAREGRCVARDRARVTLEDRDPCTDPRTLDGGTGFDAGLDASLCEATP